jgi:hypothetical protein
MHFSISFFCDSRVRMKRCALVAWWSTDATARIVRARRRVAWGLRGEGVGAELGERR